MARTLAVQFDHFRRGAVNVILVLMLALEWMNIKCSKGIIPTPDY